MTPEVELSVAQTVRCTEAEGPGKRFALWFQGCPLRCPGCCNPEMLPFEGGRVLSLKDLLPDIEVAAAVDGIEGITLLGGEPLAHAGGATTLARAGDASSGPGSDGQRLSGDVGCWRVATAACRLLAKASCFVGISFR